MIYKKNSLILSIFLITSIQILLFINNNQKSSFKYFIWKIQDVSIGRLICFSFVSGLILSSILSKTSSNHHKPENNKKKEDINDKNDYFLNREDNNNAFEIPPQRDVREPQPTISVNYRVIKNNGENQLEDRSKTSNDFRYEDDWDNKGTEW
tara:strand:- start:253 stop:708 length:456 start_codon:yes stop_codon:yes gene_type:complete